MKLSTLYTSVPEYIEFGWVAAPNAANQSVSANTITTLNLDTEITDTGNLVSAPSSNIFTVPAGTYYFEVGATLASGTAGTSVIFGLFNESATAWVSRTRIALFNYVSINTPLVVNGQFKVTGNTNFALKCAMTAAGSVGAGGLNIDNFTLSTAGTDQRTSAKLWKLS